MIDLDSMTDEDLYKLKSEIENKLNKSCIHCGEPAEYLCDYIIGFNSSNGRYLKHFESIFTCDAPLCKRHRIKKGEYHFSGEAPCFDTKDFCCSHHSHDEKLKPISIQQAKDIRENHYFKCHGTRIF